MKNGHITLPRWIQISSVWFANPFYLKVWLFFLFNAEYNDRGNLKKGQLFTNTKTIIDNCYSREGYIIRYPTKDQVRAAIDFLRRDHEWPIVDSYGAPINGPMITTRKATHGMLVTVCNYELLAYAFSTEPRTVHPDADAASPFKDAQENPTESHNINKEKENSNKERNLSAEPTFFSTCETIATRFNELSGSSYTSVDVQRYIETLLSAGNTADDIIQVIERKWSEWCNSDNMRPHFRPSIVLSKDKFREYLKAPLSLNNLENTNKQAKIENLRKELQEKEKSLLAIKESISTIDKKERNVEYHNLKAHEAELEDSIEIIRKRLLDNE